MDEIYTQQGDVILYKTTKNNIPKESKKVQLNNEFVVEHGEGVHKHKLIHPQLSQAVSVYEHEDKIYIDVHQKTELVHEEHGTTILDEGKVLYKIKEREFDYQTEEARNVLD